MVLSAALKDAAKNGDTAAIQEWFSTGTRDIDDRDQDGKLSKEEAREMFQDGAVLEVVPLLQTFLWPEGL